MATPTSASGTSIQPRREPQSRQHDAQLDCVVIIVSYNSASHVERLVGSMPAASGRLQTHTMVVENGNALDELQRRLGGHSAVEVVAAPANLGYGGGLNFGLALAPPARSVLFLNPDLTLEPGSLEELLKAAGRRGSGAAVPLMLDSDGARTHSLRREPTIMRSLGEALFGDRWPGRPSQLGEVVRSQAAYMTPSIIDWATGAALLVTGTAARTVGTWDERFFLYSEEVDFCRRLRMAGVRIWFTPDAVVRHDGGGSGAGPQLTALMAVNRVRYYRKHHPLHAALAYATVTALHSFLRAWRPGERLALRALVDPQTRAALPHRGSP